MRLLFSMRNPQALRTVWKRANQEILHILTLLEKEEYKERVYKGSAGYLPDEQTPVESATARRY